MESRGILDNLTADGRAGRIQKSDAKLQVAEGGTMTGGATITGNFTMVGGKLEVEMAGPDSAQHDALSIEGNANIEGGTIVFKFVDGYAPQVGTQLDFLTASRQSTIDNVTLEFEGVAVGFELQVNAEGGDLTFQANNDALIVHSRRLCGQGVLAMVPILLVGLLTLKGGARRAYR